MGDKRKGKERKRKRGEETEGHGGWEEREEGLGRGDGGRGAESDNKASPRTDSMTDEARSQEPVPFTAAWTKNPKGVMNVEESER